MRVCIFAAAAVSALAVACGGAAPPDLYAHRANHSVDSDSDGSNGSSSSSSNGSASNGSSSSAGAPSSTAPSASTSTPSSTPAPTPSSSSSTPSTPAPTPGSCQAPKCVAAGGLCGCTATDAAGQLVTMGCQDGECGCFAGLDNADATATFEDPCTTAADAQTAFFANCGCQ